VGLHWENGSTSMYLVGDYIITILTTLSISGIYLYQVRRFILHGCK
jgi:hypothetical protein